MINLKSLKYDLTGMYYKLDYDDDWKLLAHNKSQLNVIIRCNVSNKN